MRAIVSALEAHGPGGGGGGASGSSSRRGSSPSSSPAAAAAAAGLTTGGLATLLARTQMMQELNAHLAASDVIKAVAASGRAGGARLQPEPARLAPGAATARKSQRDAAAAAAAASSAVASSGDVAFGSLTPLLTGSGALLPPGAVIDALDGFPSDASLPAQLLPQTAVLNRYAADQGRLGRLS
jgi:hypothetical protein